MIKITLFIVQDGEGDWVSLDAELEMSDGVVTGTRCPTGHYLLIDARFELPFGKCTKMYMYFFLNRANVTILKYSLSGNVDELLF